MCLPTHSERTGGYSSAPQSGGKGQTEGGVCGLHKQAKKERKSKTLAPSFSRPPSLPSMLPPLPPPLPCRRSHRRRRQHCCRFHVQLCLGSRERSAAALSEHSDAQHVVVASQPAARAVPDRSRDAHRRDAVGSAPAQYILHGNSRSPLPLTALAAID